MRTLKIKKVCKGLYQTHLNGMIIRIESPEQVGSDFWLVTCCEYGQDNYWSECYDSKKEAVNFLNQLFNKGVSK